MGMFPRDFAEHPRHSRRLLHPARARWRKWVQSHSLLANLWISSWSTRTRSLQWARRQIDPNRL